MWGVADDIREQIDNAIYDLSTEQKIQFMILLLQDVSDFTEDTVQHITDTFELLKLTRRIEQITGQVCPSKTVTTDAQKLKAYKEAGRKTKALETQKKKVTRKRKAREAIKIPKLTDEEEENLEKISGLPAQIKTELDECFGLQPEHCDILPTEL